MILKSYLARIVYQPYLHTRTQLNYVAFKIDKLSLYQAMGRFKIHNYRLKSFKYIPMGLPDSKKLTSNDNIPAVPKYAYLP